MLKPGSMTHWNSRPLITTMQTMTGQYWGRSERNMKYESSNEVRE